MISGILRRYRVDLTAMTQISCVTGAQRDVQRVLLQRKSMQISHRILPYTIAEEPEKWTSETAVRDRWFTGHHVFLNRLGAGAHGNSPGSERAENNADTAVPYEVPYFLLEYMTTV